VEVCFIWLLEIELTMSSSIWGGPIDPTGPDAAFLCVYYHTNLPLDPHVPCLIYNIDDGVKWVYWTRSDHIWESYAEYRSLEILHIVYSEKNIFCCI
jgi:hypothetical protein